MWAEDKIPACRCTAHPAHADKRRYMHAIREEADYVVWCCQLCTEISHVPTVQVRVLPRGQAKARYQLGPQRQLAAPMVRSTRGLRTVRPGETDEVPEL